MLCQNNTRMVDALMAEHEGMFESSFRPRDEHKEELDAHGIESHGVVCVDASGETLWKHGDHQMSPDDLKSGVATVMAKLGK